MVINCEDDPFKKSVKRKHNIKVYTYSKSANVKNVKLVRELSYYYYTFDDIFQFYKFL